MRSDINYGIYYIDRELLEKMKEKNDWVTKASYTDEGRSEKFYLGPVAEHDGVPCFVPVSSKVKDFDKNLESGNRFLLGTSMNPCGNLDMTHMVPVAEPEFLTPKDPGTLGPYGRKQYQSCISNEARIKKYAEVFMNNFQYIDDGTPTTFSDIDKLIDVCYNLSDERATKTEKRRQITNDMQISASQASQNAFSLV